MAAPPGQGPGRGLLHSRATERDHLGPGALVRREVTCAVLVGGPAVRDGQLPPGRRYAVGSGAGWTPGQRGWGSVRASGGSTVVLAVRMGGGLPRKPQAAFPLAPPCHCLLPPRPAGPSSVTHPQLMLGGPQVGPRTTCSRFRWPHRPVVAAPGRGRRVQERVSRQGRRPERAHEHTSSRPSRRLPQDASSRTSQLHVFREANPHVF